LIAAYGNILNKVMLWPLNSPNTPSSPYIFPAAETNPNHEPEYFAYCGDDAWNRIFMRSRGAMSVFAYILCEVKMVVSMGKAGPVITSFWGSKKVISSGVLLENIQHNQQLLQQAHCEPYSLTIVSTFSAAEAQYSRHLLHIFSDLVLWSATLIVVLAVMVVMW